jgi:hypothetical protein
MLRGYILQLILWQDTQGLFTSRIIIVQTNQTFRCSCNGNVAWDSVLKLEPIGP